MHLPALEEKDELLDEEPKTKFKVSTVGRN
jgi:hypothetical protein